MALTAFFQITTDPQLMSKSLFWFYPKIDRTKKHGDEQKITAGL